MTESSYDSVSKLALESFAAKSISFCSIVISVKVEISPQPMDKSLLQAGSSEYCSALQPNKILKSSWCVKSNPW